MKNEKLVEMCHITKNFPGVRALDDVDFDLFSGETHVLIGENGAGKSTLVKILAGVYPLEKGTILVDGEEIHFRNTSSAQKLGISIVFQECNLIPTLTVGQNIFINHEIFKAKPYLDVEGEVKAAGKLLDDLQIKIDPTVLVENLSIGQQQMVSFARALSFKPKILILDEPTSSLTRGETELMFEILKQQKAKGVGIIYISHRLEELFEVGDRITILRDGKHIATKGIKEINLQDAIQMMVARDIKEMYPKEPAQIKGEALRLENLSRKGICQDINLKINEGEVVGLYGLVGAGRTETMRIAFGMEPMDSGAIFLRNEEVKHLSPKKVVQKGIGFVPEDRKKEGLCLGLPLKENVIRASLDKLFKSGFVSSRQEENIAAKFVKDLSIATTSTSRLAMFLSGGTQQKVVLAQWLCVGTSILILDEPTRGIDVGAKVEIYRMINKLAKAGNAILVISSELPEIMGISDRIYVMCRGKITGEFDRKKMSAEKIIACAFGSEEAINAA